MSRFILVGLLSGVLIIMVPLGGKAQAQQSATAGIVLAQARPAP